MTHKYNNTVILSQGGEHGEKIVEWWEKQNVNTGLYLCNESGFYYGLIDYKFGIYTLSDVLKANAKIIELPVAYLSSTDWKAFARDINSPQIIDLSNVEGVEMMVSENNRFWVIKKIIYKYKYSYVDEDMFHWKYAKPIEPIKKVTIQEVEQMFGCKVEIVKEVSNEQ